jgi:hypothetical protein
LALLAYQLDPPAPAPEPTAAVDEQRVLVPVFGGWMLVPESSPYARYAVMRAEQAMCN